MLSPGRGHILAKVLLGTGAQNSVCLCSPPSGFQLPISNGLPFVKYIISVQNLFARGIFNIKLE